MGEVLLVRHGETQWSQTGRHTGRTDVPLTAKGEEQARALGPILSRRSLGLVLTSPLQRAARTAQLAGLRSAQPDADLVEWDYGSYEGRTTPEIQQERPGWTVWQDGVLDGETVGQVGDRADRVLERARAFLARDDRDVVLVGHGHALRVLAARWLALPAVTGCRFRLDTGALSVLSEEHHWAALLHWNVSPAVLGP